MALFGSSRDISFIHKVNGELLDNIIQQEVHYYKLYLPGVKSKDVNNLYGEASAQKTYFRPVRLTCIIDRTQGVQTVQDDQFGIDATSGFNFKFLRLKLEELNLVPQVGDIIEDRGMYYEVDNTNEVQFIAGKDNEHSKGVGPEFGKSLTVECVAHLSRVSRLQIEKIRI